ILSPKWFSDFHFQTFPYLRPSFKKKGMKVKSENHFISSIFDEFNLMKDFQDRSIDVSSSNVLEIKNAG
ncbi:hypothetical protein JW960_15560, partial [candidate division KSB1 bacterium]|nr:hypothetical protein [candidate division KSB1 bacterium]